MQKRRTGQKLATESKQSDLCCIYCDQGLRPSVSQFKDVSLGAGWSSPVARQAHNLKVVGSNPTPATNFKEQAAVERLAAFLLSR